MWAAGGSRSPDGCRRIRCGQKHRLLGRATAADSAAAAAAATAVTTTVSAAAEAAAAAAAAPEAAAAGEADLREALAELRRAVVVDERIGTRIAVRHAVPEDAEDLVDEALGQVREVGDEILDVQRQPGDAEHCTGRQQHRYGDHHTINNDDVIYTGMYSVNTLARTYHVHYI